MAIRTFKDKRTELIFLGERAKGVSDELRLAALRKLTAIRRATRLEDLRTPPGNRLEPLKGDRAGQHSIRVNDQWRICFIWKGDGADDVELVDYH